MSQPITPERRVGDIVMVRQDDCLPKLAEIAEVDVDPDHVRYRCKWGERAMQWDWFYASEVRDAPAAHLEEIQES